MPEPEQKNVKFSTLIYALVVLVAVFLIVTGILIYFFNMNNRFTHQISRIIPYPATVVNYTEYAKISELRADLSAVKKFYEVQDFSSLGFRVDFTTEDGKKRLKIKEKNLLNKMIENIVIRRLAEEQGIKISAEMVRQEVDRKVKQSGSPETVLENLRNLYGWNIADFEKKIVRPDMYKNQLEKKVREQDPGVREAKKKIEEAMGELDAGADFSDVAKKYSEGQSASGGGDLGWFALDQMLPEIAVLIPFLKVDERSAIIESRLGFHIIRLTDKKTENEVESFKMSQILVRSRSFADWLMEQEKNFAIYIPLRDYFWDQETQAVQFRDPELREFEQNLQNNSADDISVLF